MADKTQDRGSFPRGKWKDLGDGTYAEVLALEPGSIGGGGGAGGNITTAAKGTTATGSPTSTDVDANRQALDVYVRGGGAGGGAVTIADGADVAEGTTTDTSSANTVIGLLKAVKAAVQGTLTADISDRVGRLLGHVTVDNASLAVTGTFWQATQPISGSVTANIGTTNGLALDATLIGGTQKSKLVDTGGTNVASVSAAGALKVDNSAVTQPVSGTFWQATQPVSLATNTPDVTDRAARLLGHVTVDNASIAVTGTFWQATQPISGSVGINTGSNLMGRVSLDPQTANGLTPQKLISAASTNATSVKASAGQVYTVIAHNTNAAVRYLKLYNKASAPTVGTDVPFLTLPIPGNAAGAGFVLDTGGIGIAFGTGIAMALTTGVSDVDSGAVAANEIVVNVLYK